VMAMTMAIIVVVVVVAITKEYCDIGAWPHSLMRW
jgi:hypothetical protein